MGKPTDLVQGTLDLLILKTISLEPTNGWAIAKRIVQVSGDVLQVQQGSLYPALHRLEHQGWIKSEWSESENHRRAKHRSEQKVAANERIANAACQQTTPRNNSIGPASPNERLERNVKHPKESRGEPGPGNRHNEQGEL